jgi:hypothetical protein
MSYKEDENGPCWLSLSLFIYFESKVRPPNAKQTITFISQRKDLIFMDRLKLSACKSET